MTDSRTASAATADWLGVCQRAAAKLGEILAATTETADRVAEVGSTGEGGDRTLVIDAQAEDAVFEELDKLHSEGYRFSAISEERGEVNYGDPSIRVVVDPIDGSMNAKRGLRHHSISIAVAAGETMEDVFFGFVYDFGPSEEWVAELGKGATLNGEPLVGPGTERRTDDGKLELVGIESANPLWVGDASSDLAEVCYRLRAVGSIAITMCQVAAGRLDAMLSIKPCRSVDAAAAQLIVRESGGVVAFPAAATPLGAPLDLAPNSSVVAARTAAGVAEATRATR